MVKSMKITKRVYKRKTAKKPTISKAVKTYVKKALDGEIEDKMTINYGINLGINGSAAQPANVTLVPHIAQGLGKSQRTGNEIIVKKSYIKGYINILPYNSVTNPFTQPILVKLYVISSKVSNSSTLSTSDVANTFFDTVNSNLGFQGNMLDLMLPVNTEKFRLHYSKVIKVGVANALSINSAGATDNSSFSVPFSFDLAKITGKLKFDDTTTAPTNKNIWLLLQAVAPDGSTGVAPNQVAEFHFVHSISYQDA